MKLYFAYGSNMLPQQMQERCRGARAIGSACLPDWQFFITTRGTANIRKAKGHVVYGVLWQVALHHIDLLDYFEGWSWRNYHRHILQVTPMGVGTSVREYRPAHVYVSSRSYPSVARSIYMHGAVLPGARHFGLPQAYINELESWLPRYALGHSGAKYYGRKKSVRGRKRLV